MSLRARWFLAFASIVLWSAMIWGDRIAISFWGASLLLILLVAGTGYALAVWWKFPRANFFVVLAYSAGLGWSILAAVAGLLDRVEFPGKFGFYGLPLVMVAAALAKRTAAGEARSRVRRVESALLLLVFALAIGLSSAGNGESSARALTESAFARDAGRLGTLVPQGARGLGATASLGEPFVWGTAGQVFEALGVETWLGHRALATVHAFFGLLAIFACVYLWGGNRRVAAAALVLAALGSAGAAGVAQWPFDGSAAGFGLFHFMLVLGLLLSSFPLSTRARTFGVSLLVLGAATSHLLFGLASLAAWFLAWFARRLTPASRMRRSGLELGAIAIGLFAGALLRPVSISSRNPTIEGPRNVVFMPGETYARDPAAAFAVLGLLGWLGLMFLPAALSRSGRDPGLRYVPLALLVSAAILFLPWLFPALEPVWGGDVDVLLWASCPVYLWAAFVAGSYRPKKRWILWVGWITLAAGLIPTIGSAPDRLRGGAAAHVAGEKEGWLRHLEREVAPEALIMTDPETGLLIEGRTANSVYVLPGPAMAYREADMRGRFAAAQSALNPFAENRATAHTLEELGVEYVVLHLGTWNAGEPVLDYGLLEQEDSEFRPAHWVPDSSLAFFVTERFAQDLETYRLEYDDGQVQILAFEPGDSIQEVTFLAWENPYLYEGIIRSRAPRPLGDDIYFLGFDPGPEGTRPGGRTGLEFYWAVRAQAPGDRAYRLRVYLEHGEEYPPSPRSIFGRFLRKLDELRTRRRLWWEWELPLVGGFFQPGLWEAQKVYAQKVEVELPEDLAPGTYLVRFRLDQAASFSNRLLADVASDKSRRDSYLAGKLEIIPTEESRP